MLKPIKIDGDIRYPLFLTLYRAKEFDVPMGNYTLLSKSVNGQSLIKGCINAQFG
jgi:hypothetical protein